jgi:eukaryotic-like serine/threonine-protein kinase
MTEDDFHKRITLQGMPRNGKSLPTPEVPTSIGPYRIESLLERGGMSILYLGTHPETKEPTTLKVLSQKFLSHPEIVQRFLNEAEIIAMADHPNIVKLYGHGEWEGGLYIAMEFIQGISLRQYLLQNPMSLKRALEVIIDIAYALCHLHTHGVIHRDLKPENILVTESGQIKVIDFGIAQLLNEKDATGETSRQRTIGTPIYMSPEQRENPESVSYPSDIFSLGIITYELVLGKLSHGQLHLSLMPKGLQKILTKALQPNPKDRYQDIVDFITDVSTYLNSETMEKEKKVGDQISELSENLKQTESSLLPSKIPQWEDIEVGAATLKGLGFAGIYYDFVELPNKRNLLLFAEPINRGAAGVIFTAVLRGMILALRQLISQPMEFLSKLNQLLLEDPMGQSFTFVYLMMIPATDELFYVTCGESNLWHLPIKETIIKKLPPTSKELGIDPKENFSGQTIQWKINDLIFLGSHGLTISNDKIGFTQSQFEYLALQNIQLFPQKQVEMILRKRKLHSLKELGNIPLTLISFLRK